ncbi:MAG: DNA replication/repair protein RecF [Candidatus Cloacimonetes bacterium]|nr:DNA replication/repair protein RecF [Candidatus Cloacimonadota bacterium]
MLISSIKIKNFRNYRDFELKFAPAGALIFGNNGIGKTNLLEAISYFAFGRSFRTSKDSEIINFSEEYFRIEADFIINNQDYTFQAASDKTRKIIKLNDMNIARISELYKYLKVVYFSPGDLEIISGSPIYRRSFIDQAVSQYSFEYIENLRKYKRILKQRNALLKTDYLAKEKRIWDKQFADIAAKIIRLRIKYLELFTPLLEKYYKTISGSKEKFMAEYQYSFPNSDSDIADNLLDHLLEIETQEKHQERTLAGPHLDDIGLFIDDHPARNFSSQGQQRSIAIAMRLVQNDLIIEKDQDTPILMFDDVLAELDDKRAKRIVNALEGNHQIFISTPNISHYRSFGLKEIDLKNELERKNETQ